MKFGINPGDGEVGLKVNAPPNSKFFRNRYYSPFFVTLFASQTAAFIDDTKTKTRQAIHEAQRENEAQLNNAKLRFGHNR